MWGGEIGTTTERSDDPDSPIWAYDWGKPLFVHVNRPNPLSAQFRPFGGPIDHPESGHPFLTIRNSDKWPDLNSPVGQQTG
jgi:hypothetical protein